MTSIESSYNFELVCCLCFCRAKIILIILLQARIIYTRFHTKSFILLHSIKNQNIEAEIQKLIVETLGPLQGKHEVFKDGAIKWRLPLLESMELEMYKLQKICRFFKRKFVRGSKKSGEKSEKLDDPWG